MNLPLALAGIWASWKDPDSGDRVLTCSILTGRPNELVADVHDRMPMILDRPQWEDWLDRSNENTDQLQQMLTAGPDVGDILFVEAMGSHPVSTLVNKVANNYAECIAPLETGAIDQESPT